ncbi:MAG: hypothetical protein AB8E82_07385 [Aureispira sp.]
MSEYTINAEPRETAVAPNGKAYAKLAYYMEHLETQKEWKKIPGIVVADTIEEAQTKGKELADQLDGLTIFEMSKKVKKFIEEGKMFANVRSLK